MSKIVIEQVSVEKLTPYAGNPMVHPDEQIRMLAAGIRKFGFRQPILADINGVIISGHGRLMAAKVAGLQHVPVIYTSDLTEDQISAYRIADNKLAQLSSWNMEVLSDEMNKLSELDFDLELTGFSDEEINNLLSVDFLPEGDFRTVEAARPETPPAPAPVSRAETEQIRREPEKATGELVEVTAAAPRATDDKHSVFDCVMPHNDKLELVQLLERIRMEHKYERVSQALMHIVRQFQ